MTAHSTVFAWPSNQVWISIKLICIQFPSVWRSKMYAAVYFISTTGTDGILYFPCNVRYRHFKARRALTLFHWEPEGCYCTLILSFSKTLYPHCCSTQVYRWGPGRMGMLLRLSWHVHACKIVISCGAPQRVEKVLWSELEKHYMKTSYYKVYFMNVLMVLNRTPLKKRYKCPSGSQPTIRFQDFVYKVNGEISISHPSDWVI